MLLGIAIALADRVYSPAPLEGEAAMRVAATVPGARAMPFAELSGTDTLARDREAITTLRRELEACRPLLAAFDGELEIMARLDKAISDVGALTSDDDRRLVWDALVLQGYAVQKYFQAGLGADPAAAPYRIGSGAEARVSAWVDATGLGDVPVVDPTRIPEAELRIAFDAVQAWRRAMPSMTVVVGELARGAEVWIDGKRVEGGPGTRLIVPPGRHWLHVQAGDAVLWREARRFEAGSTVTVSAPFGPQERDALLARLVGDPPGSPLPEAAARHLAAFGEPTYVALPDGKDTRLVRVDRGAMEPVRLVNPERAAEADRSPWAARVAVGAGWLSTGDFFLLNVEDGAPSARATVNSVTPAFGVGGGWRGRWLAVGAGVDAQLTPGEWHRLPSGDGQVRAFVYPHLSAGLPWVQVSGGFQSPWYPAGGVHATIPVWGSLEVVGRAVYGFPTVLERGEDPAFTPTPALSAWGGVAWRLPR